MDGQTQVVLFGSVIFLLILWILKEKQKLREMAREMESFTYKSKGKIKNVSFLTDNDYKTFIKFFGETEMTFDAFEFFKNFN